MPEYVQSVLAANPLARVSADGRSPPSSPRPPARCVQAGTGDADRLQGDDQRGRRRESDGSYNLVNFLRTLASPEDVEHWSLTTLREKLIKIGARVLRHGRYVVLQLSEVAVPRALCAEIVHRIDRLRPRPPPLPA